MQDAPEPLSWLMLERYALGELSPDERKDVEARLARSEADRACLAEIMADQSELPPLDEVSPIASARKPRASWLGWSAALAAAAAALLVVLHRPAPEELDQHVKGSDVALRLISDRQGDDPTRFSAGERFKLQITCPPASAAATSRLGRARSPWMATSPRTCACTGGHRPNPTRPSWRAPPLAGACLHPECLGRCALRRCRDDGLPLSQGAVDERARRLGPLPARRARATRPERARRRRRAAAE
jgi:hypothetical protein